MTPIPPEGPAEHSLLNRFVRGLCARADIPLRLMLWNGAHHDLGLNPSVTVHLPHPGALKYFVPPSLDNLADRKLPEYGSDKDFQLIQALNQLKGRPVMVSKTLIERKEDKKED